MLKIYNSQKKKCRFKFHDFVLDSVFSDMTPNTQAIKEKKISGSSLKLKKSFCLKGYNQESKVTIHRMKENI